MNREGWLEAAVEEMRTLLGTLAEATVPKVHASVGWPSRGGTSLKKRTVGQCWASDTSADGVSQVFISPVMDDAVQVLGVLIHELIHAWDNNEHGHRGPFVAAAKAVGLTGPWTATSVGPDLLPLLQEVVERLGPYPHSKLTPGVKERVQTTRMLKVVCPDCGYTVRTTQKWLDAGLPSCPAGDEMILEVKE